MGKDRNSLSRAHRRAEILREARRSGNIAETCRRRGISRTVFYKWRRRFETGGLEALADGSRRPHRAWRKTPGRDVAKIVFLRLALGWGPARIQSYLLRFHGLRLSGPGIWKILRRLGYGRRPASPPAFALQGGRTLYVTTEPAASVSEKRRPGSLWIARDVEAGVLVVRSAVSLSAGGAAAFVDDAAARFPLAIAAIETPLRDEFGGFFHWHVLSLGFEHRFGKGAYPFPESGDGNLGRLVAALGAPRLDEGAVVFRDERINRAVEAWEGLTSPPKGTAGSAGLRSR